MTRFIMPIILIAISVSLFFVFTDPLYNEISKLRAEAVSYSDALDNSKALENERDKLTAKYNSINPENLIKLEKFLPENVDNIRLILEIEQIALPYGMVLKDVKYSTVDKKTANANASNGVVIAGSENAELASKDYGVFDLEFSTSGSYDNFINFTKDLENNLRMVNISSISFSSDSAGSSANPKANSPEVYKYDFKIKTYWLKN